MLRSNLDLSDSGLDILQLVSINIKPQKHYLNMNPACSASLLMNDTDHLLHTVSFTAHIHTEARDARGVFSICRLTK